MKRYPGIRPFTTADRPLFNGREQEKRDLFQLIVLNEIVVLFGKSGIGKTSLLQAGVCPDLEERNLHPVFIRLNNTELAPEVQVYQKLREDEYIPKEMPEGKTLWEYFKKFWYVDVGEVFTPVIVFDQFEELFTLYTPDQRQAFINQFADVVNGNMPKELRHDLTEEAEDDLETPPRVKFVLSIRSDYLYLLDELSADIPAILRCRYQLKMLDRQAATKAIVIPAALASDFESPPFQYSPEALDQIIQSLGQQKSDRLRGNQPSDNQEIEAFQLQLLCQQLEDQIIADDKPAKFTIEPEYYGGSAGIQRIIKEFYTTVLARIPDQQRDQVEKLLATGLIRNQRRIIMEESAIKEEFQLSQDILDQLHAERLLRKEARKGQFYYEVSHDTLIGPILERYQVLAAREEQARQERELVEAKQQAEKLRQRAEEQAQLKKLAEDGTRIARKRTRLASLALVITMMLATFAIWQYILAKSAQDIAIAAKNDAQQEKERADSLRIEAETAAAQALRDKIAAITSDSLAQLERDNAVRSDLRANKNLDLAREEQRKAQAIADTAKAAKELAENRLDSLQESQVERSRLVKRVRQVLYTNKIHLHTISLRDSLPNQAIKHLDSIFLLNLVQSPDDKVKVLFLRQQLYIEVDQTERAIEDLTEILLIAKDTTTRNQALDKLEEVLVYRNENDKMIGVLEDIINNDSIANKQFFADKIEELEVIQQHVADTTSEVGSPNVGLTISETDKGFNVKDGEGEVFFKKHSRGLYTRGNQKIIGLKNNHLELIKQAGLTQSEIDILLALAENLGNFDAINTYDSNFLSFGIFQWTIGYSGDQGELPALLKKIKEKHPALFMKYLGRFGLDISSSTGSTYGYLLLDERLVNSSDSKQQFRTPEWAFRFWIMAQSPEVQVIELEHAISRLKTFYWKNSYSINGFQLSNIITSEYGVALLLDNHVNRPGYVKPCIQKAMEVTGLSDPSTWTTIEENRVLEAYLKIRQTYGSFPMTDALRRGKIVMEYLDPEQGTISISNERGTFESSFNPPDR